MADYRYLKAFHAAARHLNFTKAARELRISVSALSRQITLLEASVGGQLFIRGNRQVALSPLGKGLAAQVGEFERGLKNLGAPRPLRIGCLQSVFEYFLIDVMTKHPRVFSDALDIEIGSSRALLSRLEVGELDLAITNVAVPETSLLSSFRLFQESVDWIGHRGSDRVIVFSALEDHYGEELLGAAKNRIRINSFHAAASMVDLGLGRALVAKPAIRGGHRGEKQWIHATFPSYEMMPPRLAALVEILRKTARK